MEERAEQIGGVFRLTSQPGQGTLVEIFVEVASRKHDRHVRRAS
jgi:nitrate/nitrite-specific signal transduction histidine kinase